MTIDDFRILRITKCEEISDLIHRYSAYAQVGSFAIYYHRDSLALNMD
jgi:hypothetical protein